MNRNTVVRIAWLTLIILLGFGARPLCNYIEDSRLQERLPGIAQQLNKNAPYPIDEEGNIRFDKSTVVGKWAIQFNLTLLSDDLIGSDDLPNEIVEETMKFYRLRKEELRKACVVVVYYRIDGSECHRLMISCPNYKLPPSEKTKSHQNLPKSTKS